MTAYIRRNAGTVTKMCDKHLEEINRAKTAMTSAKKVWVLSIAVGLSEKYGKYGRIRRWLSAKKDPVAEAEKQWEVEAYRCFDRDFPGFCTMAENLLNRDSRVLDKIRAVSSSSPNSDMFLSLEEADIVSNGRKFWGSIIERCKDEVRLRK